MIKLTGCGDMEIRNGEDDGWAQRTWRAWRGGSLWAAARQEINPNNNKSQIRCPDESLAKGPGKEGKSRQEQTYRDLGTQAGMTAVGGS